MARFCLDVYEGHGFLIDDTGVELAGVDAAEREAAEAAALSGAICYRTGEQKQRVLAVTSASIGKAHQGSNWLLQLWEYQLALVAAT